MKKIAYSLILSLLAANIASAHDNDVIIENHCELTPAMWQLTVAPPAEKNNNLRRKMGATEFAEGDPIIVEGRILDINCAPVAEAVVEIWQGDAFGNYNPQKIDKNFSNTGTAITDNMGVYRFLTIFPGMSNKHEAPHIHFRVKHKDFLPFETSMYFENQASNVTDRNLTREIPKSKKDLLLAKAKKLDNNEMSYSIKYVFDITLEGNNKYLTY